MIQTGSSAAFYVDVGETVGLGHLSRCRALARAIELLGRRVTFTGEDPAAVWMERSGLSVRRLATRSSWDLLVVDSYRITPRRLKDLRRRSRTLVLIDDFACPPAPCDWVINSGVSAASYPWELCPNLMLGPRFHPLRDEFLSRPRGRRSARRLRDVLVTLGGGDGYGFYDEVLRAALSALPAGRLHATLGPLAGRPPPAWAEHPRVVWHKAPNMRRLMEACGLAISGGGQTLYELAYLGVPTVAVALAENQMPNVKGMAEAGTLLSGGRARKGFGRPLAAALRRAAASPALRRAMSENGRRLVDGLGARRVAAVLCLGAAA